MLITLLKAKLHMATITQADLNYQGSLTIDEDLMDAVGMVPYEKVLISNTANTNRFETYAIVGKRGSGVICLNGPAARLGKVGDRIVVFAFCHVPAKAAKKHKPRILILDKHNRPVTTSKI